MMITGFIDTVGRYPKEIYCIYCGRQAIKMHPTGVYPGMYYFCPSCEKSFAVVGDWREGKDV